MIGLLANTALIILLAMTNWDRLLGLLWGIYSAAAPWLTTSTILGLYGLVLVYLLVVVHVLGTSGHSPRTRRKNRLVPYYKRDGRLVSMLYAAICA